MQKIMHVCVGGPYTEGFTYQENILTKHHRRLGYDVVIAATPLYFETDGSVGHAPLGRSINEDDVTVVRLPFAKPRLLSAKLKKVSGLRNLFEEEAPDIIFLHGIQTMASSDAAWYMRSHENVRLYVDNHVDESNMGGTLHRLILDEVLWRHEGKTLIPYASKFYGVLPARVKTLTEVYGIPNKKCQLLVMGYDDYLDVEKKENAKTQVSSWLYEQGVEDSDIILCTGGKIDAYKREVWTLLRFVVSGEFPSNMKLVIFGSIDFDKAAEFAEMCSSSGQLLNFGWADKYQMSALIDRADAGIFPGRHSVLWEQVVGQATPLFIKTLRGYEHLDIDGNTFCLGEQIDVSALQRMVKHIEDAEAFEAQKAAAEAAASSFRYSQIARMSIGLV